MFILARLSEHLLDIFCCSNPFGTASTYRQI